MHRQALAVGVLLLFASFVLTFVLDELAASYTDLQPLATLTLILLIVGTVMTGYSIWEEVWGKTASPNA